MRGGSFSCGFAHFMFIFLTYSNYNLYLYFSVEMGTINAVSEKECRAFCAHSLERKHTPLNSKENTTKTKKRLSKKGIFLSVIGLVCVVLAISGVLIGGREKEPVGQLMRDAVLHEGDKIDLFGLSVNPSVLSGLILTAALLFLALLLRLFVIPHFELVPRKLQNCIEALTELFEKLARQNSPAHQGFIGAYCFSAGVYIFCGTCFELLGLQVVAKSGESVSLPAVSADINAAIALGFFSYGVILFGGLIINGPRGAFHALKDFSLPISMSFRLFGALLSGLLVTELVYYYLSLSFVLPVIVGILFTLLHALIQAYVLTMLTAMFYGEATAPHTEKPKKEKKKLQKAGTNQ